MTRALTPLIIPVFVGLWGCGSPERSDEAPAEPVLMQEDTDSTTEGLLQGNDAVIDIVHASPDAPAVDIYVNDQKAVDALAYRTATGNIPLQAGAYDVKIRAAGADPQSPAAFQTSLPLSPRARLLLVARGRLGDPGGSDTAFTVGAYPFGQRGLLTARLRLLHAAPSAPAVDIRAGRSLAFQNVPYGQAANYARFLFGVRAGTELGVRAAGGREDLAQVTLPALRPGQVFTAIAFGEINPLAADDRFFAVSAVDESTGRLVDLPVRINSRGAPARFYAFHASPDAPAVDLALSGGPVLAAGLSYQGATSLLAVPPGVYPVEVRPSGSDTAVLSANAKLLPGLTWAIFARGALGGSGAQALGLSAIPAGDQRPAAGTVALRVVHASPDAPAVDIAVNGAVVSGLAFRDASAILRVPPAALVGHVTVRAAGSPTDLFEIPVDAATADSLADTTLSIYATGTLGDAQRPFTAVAVIEAPAADPLTALPLTTRALP